MRSDDGAGGRTRRCGRELERQYAEDSVDSDPRLAAEALMKLVDSDDPPLRLLLGSVVFDMAIDVSRAADARPGRAGSRSAVPPSTASRCRLVETVPAGRAEEAAGERPADRRT